MKTWKNTISRFMLDSCPQGFHQPLSVSNPPDLPFPTSAAGISSSKANTVVRLLTNLPSLSHRCCKAFALPVSPAGTNHLSAFSHVSALDFQITLSDLGLPPAIGKCNRKIPQSNASPIQSLLLTLTCFLMLKMANLCWEEWRCKREPESW